MHLHSSPPPLPTVASAAQSFRRYFVELREAFLERDALFTQIELALLCREHVLMVGPPGTAKSAIASAVRRRVVDEKTSKPSLFAKQLTESTVQTDLIGPVDFKVLTETGRTEYLTDDGMLGATSPSSTRCSTGATCSCAPSSTCSTSASSSTASASPRAASSARC